ncbi:hypothetical protein PHYBOEH_011229 [Phytophthora boehmeriae]|uniref:CSC1/OSCA1-like cytosolic domain-containing protein n=1 Tax=Phytophthora boehmeriae TaxID=109152 RepID=A0A8T1VJ44_9STRA|nr:hypothetical protein PHYBOEH_011229 [Phytophthora boehmeriae]
MGAVEPDVPAGLSMEDNRDLAEEQPALVTENDIGSGEVGHISSVNASDDFIADESTEADAAERAARMTEDQLALKREDVDVDSEVSGEDAVSDEAFGNNRTADTVAAGVGRVPDTVNEAVSVAVEDIAELDAVSENEQALPPDENDIKDEPHQILDVAALETGIPAEVAQENTPSLARTRSKVSGSFPMTREERVKSMVKSAEGKARKDRLGEGAKGVFQATMDDIGALGIGMQLYFMLTKYLSVVFLCMGIVALPEIMENTYGHGITSKTVDPLQLAYASIGNGGVNSDTAANPRNCLPIGDIDCTWETVDTPMTSNPRTVTWIITLTDCLYTFLFLCFLLFYSYRAKRAIKAHKTKHFTPARYAVMVRGLPKDATEKEIMEHFNNLYDPTKDEEYSKLWFGFYWGKRQKVKRSRSKKAVNNNIVSNVDHLEGATTITKELYLSTWIAEVSVAHPTGGLLRTFLSMESLAREKTEAQLLLHTLEEEKSRSPMEFKSADEKLIHATRKRLDKLEDRLENAQARIKVLKDVLPPSAKVMQKKKKQERHDNLSSKDKFKAAANAARDAATKTEQKFNWEACEFALEHSSVP